MNLHEYQSKKILKSYGLPILNGYLCYTPLEVEASYDNLKSAVCVVKAQVHAGGRGKAGGVKLAKSAKEAKEAANQILGMNLITPQTGAEGKVVKKVYVEAGCNIAKEYYLSLVLDRASKSVSVIACSEGGTEIEELAEHSPEKIFKAQINPSAGYQSFQGLEIGFQLGLDSNLALKFSGILSKLYSVFMQKDLALIEINPLVLTKDNEFVLLDAKCSVEENALFRHPDLKEMNDYEELDPRELQASKFGLSYVGLDGTIGCMVNGAGLAMATMDIIKFSGGEPANFLDVGGGASKETVTEAFKILLSDEKVKGILINIFGGIMKCDVIAEGVISAAKELGVKVPLVVRLQGTNVEQGRKLLSESGLNIVPAETMSEAAKKIVELAK